MNDTSYPKPVAEVVSTLADICRHQKRSELVELLDHAHAHFDPINYDNWNGGTTTWALRLEVPTVLYASVQARLGEIEKELADKLGYLDRLYSNDPLGEVTITPLTSAEMSLGQMMAPADADVRRLWTDGFFRLFLSHVSLHKVKVSQLKVALSVRGISAFVAHEDIEPSLEWQDEISLALRSMHALAALITTDFHASNWTDQEIGWALGRGMPVIPIQLGVVPYGFVGKIQAIRGSLDDTESLASSITQALLRNGQSHMHMRRAIVEAFEKSGSFAASKTLKNLIVTVDDFTADEKDRLRDACKSNNQISGSWGVTEAIFSAFGSPNQPTTSPDHEVPF
jgi:TIR domain